MVNKIAGSIALYFSFKIEEYPLNSDYSQNFLSHYRNLIANIFNSTQYISSKMAFTS
jgi:hypothetical protein